MTIREAWQRVSHELASHGFEDALLEAELLLRHVLKVGRTEFYARASVELSDSELSTLNGLLEQRLGHKPSAYLRHSREFYGLEFYVDERVLIPRPETELLVDKALEMAGELAALSLSKRHTLRKAQRGVAIVDVGTGSGAIAVALAVHIRQARIFATDISAQALEVARINCEKHGVADRVQLLQGDLLGPLPEAVDIIVANLPYVADKDYEGLAPEITRYEPRSALAAGPDGLDYIRRLIDQAPGKLKPKGAILLEVGIGQAQTVAGLMQKDFSGVSVATDLAGLERVVVGRL